MSDLFLTNHQSGKMDGMQSLNTSALANPYCGKMSQYDSLICSNCYARRLERLRPNVKERYEENGEILSSRLISKDDLPDINREIFRLHSFGELINKTHARNFINLIKKNPQTIFGWWIKRLNLVKKAFEKKPNNLILIFSNPIQNQVMDLDNLPSFVDKTFNVLKTDNGRVNCEGKLCKSCQKCYSFNSADVVIEKKH